MVLFKGAVCKSDFFELYIMLLVIPPSKIYPEFCCDSVMDVWKVFESPVAAIQGSVWLAVCIKLLLELRSLAEFLPQSTKVPSD